jgi:hypothetical protein
MKAAATAKSFFGDSPTSYFALLNSYFEAFRVARKEGYVVAAVSTALLYELRD